MLEEALERLTVEVTRLREAVERQTAILERMRSGSHPAPEAPGMAKAYLTEREVADLAAVSLAAIRRWRSSRMGPPFKKFGASVRYSHNEVTAWLDAQGG